MRHLAFSSALAGVVACSAVVSPAAAAPTPTQVAFSACPKVNQTIYPAGAPSADDLASWTTRLGCGQPVASAGYTDCSAAQHTNKDLGLFFLDQNPLGVGIQLSAPNDCTTNPPKLGAGVGNGALMITVTKTGFCPQTSTVTGHTGNASVILPIGDLSLGTYAITVGFPDQGPWLGTHATGTLRVGGIRFTETETIALAKPTTAFATLLQSSIAGRGAGELVATRTAGTKVRLTGTGYYACGTITIDARVTLGRRVIGSGVITGGTGNYADLKGSFKARGAFNRRTGRGTIVLTGIATY
jgi:hypothetical protein